MEVSLSEKRLNVIVKIGEHDAAYTADEAMELSHAIESEAAQRGWNIEAEQIVEYIRDLIKIIEAPKETTDKVAGEMAEKWEDSEIIKENGN